MLRFGPCCVRWPEPLGPGPYADRPNALRILDPFVIVATVSLCNCTQTSFLVHNQQAKQQQLLVLPPWIMNLQQRTQHLRNDEQTNRFGSGKHPWSNQTGSEGRNHFIKQRKQRIRSNADHRFLQLGTIIWCTHKTGDNQKDRCNNATHVSSWLAPTAFPSWKMSSGALLMHSIQGIETRVFNVLCALLFFLSPGSRNQATTSAPAVAVPVTVTIPTTIALGHGFACKPTRIWMSSNICKSAKFLFFLQRFSHCLNGPCGFFLPARPGV